MDLARRRFIHPTDSMDSMVEMALRSEWWVLRMRNDCLLLVFVLVGAAVLVFGSSSGRDGVLVDGELLFETPMEMALTNAG